MSSDTTAAFILWAVPARHNPPLYQTYLLAMCRTIATGIGATGL